MCGIVGIVNKSAKPHQDRVVRMVESLEYRGPDDHGLHLFGQCILGHSRLAIIDKASGQQPMLSSEQRTGIVFNGEIYGYEEIEKRLTNYRFKTKSDTEVILVLYEIYGENLFDKLPEAFAFGLWDDRGRHLIGRRNYQTWILLILSLARNSQL